MGWVNWLWGGDESEEGTATRVVARDSWLGGTRFEKITLEQYEMEQRQKWWKLWNWE